MTDSDLRKLRDDNKDDGDLGIIINRLIRSRRNGQMAYANRLEAIVISRAGLTVAP